MFIFYTSIFVIILSLIAYNFQPFFKKSSAPIHYNRNEGQETLVVPELIPKSIANDLMDTVFAMGEDGGIKIN